MPKKTATKEDFPNQLKWKALFRGSLLSTTINKHVNYVGFADRRAQGIITINAILIPIALSKTTDPYFMTGAIIAISTALLSMTTAMISLYPKKYGSKNHQHPDLLHFSQIQQYQEHDYLDQMKTALSDTSILAEMAVKDLYHISSRILAPKFRWLKISYFLFLAGNIIAVLAIAIINAS